MTQKEELFRGVSCAAWGYLFVYIDVKIESVSLLPAFVGYLLFLSAIKRLEGEQRDLALLRPLGILMALWCGADWLFSWTGGTLENTLPVLDLIISLVNLYFHFQLMTDFAAIAAAHQEEGMDIDRRLLRWRTMQTLLLTVAILVSYGTGYFPEWVDTVMLVLAGVYLVAGICLMAALFSLRRLFR